MTHAIDIARLKLILNDLRLPAIKQNWQTIAEQSDKEGWPAARFLASLAEHEIAERDRRRIERHLAEARLLPGKTLDSFDFDVVPMISRAHVMAICAGDSWIKSGANVILIGGPGGGKSHLASAIGLALIENGWRGEHHFGLRTVFPTGCQRFFASLRMTAWGIRRVTSARLRVSRRRFAGPRGRNCP